MRVERRKEATRDIVRFTAEITRLADRATGRSDSEKGPLRACMMRWLGDWATGDALLGQVNQDGAYERKWQLAAWTLAYLRLYCGRSPETPPPLVSNWFRKLAAAVRAEYPAGAAKKNNHYYWAALAVAATGVVLGDTLSYDWGMTEYRSALAAVDENGFLPLELKRGAAALHYHVFSASALTMLAAIDAANGGAPLDQRRGALQHLVKTTLMGLDDPTPFVERAGAQQAMSRANMDGRELAWLEAYAFLNPDPTVQSWLERLRPLRTIWLGGNMTRSFAGAKRPL
jgi:poly(beta-D-mannuronate) lyase